jgi:mRNA interferase RelE/StbE
LSYRVLLTDEARSFLAALDKKTLHAIARKIESLKESPEKRGKRLHGELAAYRSLPAAGRYRIVYRIDRDAVVVLVIGVGIRKEGDRIDVYETIRRFVKQRLIE